MPRPPITSDLQNVRVRFDLETYATIQRLARENERSVAAQIRFMVLAQLNGRKK